MHTEGGSEVRFDYDTSYEQPLGLLRHRSDRLAYGVLLAALLAFPWLAPKFYVGELTYIFILCIAGVGVMVLTGYTGQVSLGHGSFVGVGAYVHALLLAQGVPFVPSIVGASLVAGAVGLLIGLPAIRVSGLYLAMVTLAFSFVIEHVLGNWKSLTGGFNGMAVGEPRVWGLDLGQLRPLYYLSLGALVLVVVAMTNLMRTRTGRAFVGVRDSETAAHGLGIHVAGYKVLAFVLSATICGFAGGLLAHHLQFLTPEAFGMMLSMELVLIVVIGGLGSLHGAVFGALLIGALPTFISHVKPLLGQRIGSQSGLETFVFGAVLALFVLFEPRGLYGRWLKLRGLFETFPLYRKDTFRRVKTYMRSERYR